MVRRGPVGKEIYVECRKRKSNIKILTITIKSKTIDFFDMCVQVRFFLFLKFTQLGRKSKARVLSFIPFLEKKKKNSVMKIS